MVLVQTPVADASLARLWLAVPPSTLALAPFGSESRCARVSVAASALADDLVRLVDDQRWTTPAPRRRHVMEQTQPVRP